MRKNNKGFTLIELMIVLVIIGALVSFMGLVLRVYIERGRESTDLMNVRSACSQLEVAAIAKDCSAEYKGQRMFQNGDYVCEVELKQKIMDWQNKSDLNLAGISKKEDFGNQWLFVPLDKESNTCKITYNTTNCEITLDWAGGKVEIPHIYKYTIGQAMEIYWSRKKDNLRYVKLIDNLIYDEKNEWQVTALSGYFDLDENNGVTFRTPRKREVAKYINVNNYTYRVAVEFVNPKDTRQLGNGAPAVAANNDHVEEEIQWGKELIYTTSGDRENTKAMLQFEKKDKDGNSVRMSQVEVDYLMTLYHNPNLSVQ